MDLMRVKASASSELFKLAMSAKFADLNLPKIGMKQVQKVLRACLAAPTYVGKDLRVRELFRTIFRTGQSSVALINRDPFLQTVLNSTRRKCFATLIILAPSVLQVKTVFLCKAIVEKAI